jgi:hypothetical protein
MSRDRFLIFPQEMVKIYVPTDIWIKRRYFDKSCRYNSGTVRERRHPYKLGGLSAQVT